MSNDIQSLWNFDSIPVDDKEHKAVILYSRMTRATSEGKQSMAGLVHRVGAFIQSEFTIDEIGVQKRAIATKFDRYWESEFAYIMSDEAGENKITEHQLRALDAAVRKISNTLGYGGDLKVLDTTSKCEKFNTAEAKKKAELNLAKELREEAEAMAKQQGLKEGTAEFIEFVNNYIKEYTPDNVDGSKSGDSLTYNVFSKKVGGFFEKLHNAGMNDKELLDLQNSIELMLQKRLDGLLANAAADTLLNQEQAG